MVNSDTFIEAQMDLSSPLPFAAPSSCTSVAVLTAKILWRLRTYGSYGDIVQKYYEMLPSKILPIEILHIYGFVVN